MAMRRRKKQRRQRPRVSSNRAVTPERKYLGASTSSRLGPNVGRRMRQSGRRQRRRRSPERIAERHLRSGKPLRTASEDSGTRIVRRLRRHGWTYRNGAWRRPTIGDEDKSLGGRNTLHPGWRGRSEGTKTRLEPRDV